MRAQTKLSYPTAKVAGADIRLALRTTKGIVGGSTSAEFFLEIMKFIEKHSSVQESEIPLQTTGSNTLIAWEPKHQDGREFNNFVEYRLRNGKILYINTNHPRFFALRQGGKILEQFGLSVTEVGPVVT